MERININEIGNTAPEGMYITKKDADKVKLMSAIFIILTSVVSLNKILKFKKHK